MLAKVLVVDDDPAIRRLLRRTLARANYEVVEAGDARTALTAAVEQEPDAILLDLGLPDRDGLSLIPILVNNSNRVVLIVSARDDVDEKVAALDLGAHDFVSKPFDTSEVLARLRVALRYRGHPQGSPRIVKLGDLAIDSERRTVVRAGREIHLTRKEHEVLAILVRHHGRVVTHERALAAAWGGEEEPRIEYLRIVIRNLRQKIEHPSPVGSVISNEVGVGYRLRADHMGPSDSS